VKRLIVATGNAGKLREFRAALRPDGIEVAGLEALSSVPEVEETGATFEENARIKAEAYSACTDEVVVAEDSGLEVDALGGEPGVRSARYGGPGLDDPGRVRLVLERMEGVPDEQRTARFRCVMALARHGKVIATFEGSVKGHITHAPVGDNGFGYDPIFFHESLGCTFAQVSREQKQQLSHRGKAIEQFKGTGYLKVWS
jgi:XTP/dITP diphosphohydrolase